MNQTGSIPVKSDAEGVVGEGVRVNIQPSEVELYRMG